jgi:hypothetical protein
MKRPFKIIAVAVLVVIVVMVGAVVYFSRLAARSPEVVTSAVQNQLRQHFPLPISIAKARFEWKQGPRVILTNVTIDSPGAITLRIKSITAYLTIWRLIYGNVTVNKLRLVEPAGEVDVDGLRRLRLHQASGSRPVVIMWKGSVKFIYQGMDFPLNDLSGRITRDWVNLRARTLGGRVLLQADLVKPGKLTFDAYGIPLDQLDSSFKGSAHMSLAMEDTKTGKTGAFSFQAKDLALPFIKGTISKVVASAALSSDSQKMTFSDISIKTPLAEVNGKAEVAGVQDLDKFMDAMLTLDASSKDFDYEKVVAVLPTQSLPDWLNALLTKQIRGGRSRFSSARYQGLIRDFLSGAALLDNLYVVQELNGQTFGAGYAPYRFTGITGQVIYGKGDIRLSNISGVMGASRLKRVDMVFSGAGKSPMRVGVDVDLDMPAADFINAWRAAMVPPKLYGFLDPVTNVKGGQVKALVKAYFDEGMKNPFRSMGDIQLSKCSYSWGSHSIINQSGSIHAESFSAPQRFVFSGSFDKTHIKKLDASLAEPFGKRISRFTLLAENLPPAGRLSMENGAIKITGSGIGASVKGSFELGASGISYLTDKYTFSTPKTSAKGDFSARLVGHTSIDAGNIIINTPSSTLSAAAAMKQDTGSVALSGRLNLKDITTKTPQGTQELKGLAEGSLKVSWGDVAAYDGHLVFNDATIPFQDGSITIDGPLVVSTPLVSSDSFRITSGDATVTLSGRLTLDDRPFFRGNALIKGMGTGTGEMSLKGLDTIRAEGTLRFADCVFSGLPVNSATAQADLKDGILSLTDMEIDTVSGSAKGTMLLAMDGAASFDMSVLIKGADMSRLLRATKAKSSIDGSLDLQGRLFGSPDSVSGTLALNARNGEIRKYALFSQIFSLLNVYKIVLNQDMDFMSKNFTYNRITSTLNIKDNVVEFDDFAIESNSIQISAVGRYTLKTKKIDAHVGVQPLESVDLTISKIPLVGWVLTDEKGKMLVVNMSLKGTMDEPRVRVEPINTLSNTVAASLLRSLKLPGHIIDDTLKLIGE